MPYDPNGAIVLTGICGKLGRHLAKRLHREYEVIGIDRRPFPGCPKDIKHYQIDIRRNKVQEIFAHEGIRAVIHMAIMHDPRMDAEEHHSFNVLGTKRIMDYCVRHNIPKLVLLSSSGVYGPRPDNTQFITEEMPLMAAERFGDIRDLVMVDMAANMFLWRHPEIETVVLRPVHIVGRVSNAPSNYLRLSVCPVMMGYDPMIQLIHEDDVVEALLLSLKKGIKGIYNVVGPDVIPLSLLLKKIGRTIIPVPDFLFERCMKIAWRLKFTSFPPPEIDYLRFVCMVDGSKWEKETGFKPKRTIEDIIALFRENSSKS